MTRTVSCVLLVGLAGCGSGPVPTTARLEVAQQGEDATTLQATLLAWFDCQECREGQLERVVALGARVVPMLGGTLEGGVTPARLERSRRFLEQSYDSLREYAKDRPSIEVPLTREAYVDVHLEAMTARWQARAALALGRIATPEAKAFLRDALTRQLRADVRAAVETALR